VHDRELVPGEGPVGEDVDDVEVQPHAPGLPDDH
jgi:hypothetical protein